MVSVGIELPWSRISNEPYEPTIPGYYFHGARDRMKLYGGSVGGSKTTTLACEAITLSLRYDNNRGFVGERDFDDLRRGLYQEILNWLPTDKEGRIYQHNKSEHWIRFYNGSEIHFVELKDEPRNVNLGWAAIDQAEKVPFQSFNWLLTRLRLPVPYRPILLSANPEPGWVKDEFVVGSRVEDTGETRLSNEPLLVYRKDGHKLFVPAFPSDNPHLPDDYVENLYASLPDTLVERLLKGSWDVVENAIYPQLDRATHFRDIPETITWVDGAIGVDYGDVHPHAATAVSVDSGGRFWVRESWEGHSFDDLVANVKRMKQQYGILRVNVDPMLKGWDKATTSPIGGVVTRADGSPGSRKLRIGLVSQRLDGPRPRFTDRRGQSPSMYFDQNGAGIDELYQEAIAYKWEVIETDRVHELQPVRKNDDRVAAWEYAVAALETGGSKLPLRASMGENGNRADYRPLATYPRV